jgi:hypothetical protein
MDFPEPGPVKPPPTRTPAPFPEMLIGSLAGLVLLMTGAVAVGVDFGGVGGDEAQAEEVVAGATLERPAPTAPPVTVTTRDLGAAFAAELAATEAANAATSTTTTTKPPTTTTTAPATTTTTVPPQPMGTASASTTGAGVALSLDVGPADGARSLQGHLSVGFEDSSVLRAVRIDFGDGTALTVDLVAWDCNAPGAPNPYDVALPAHTYGGPGTYAVAVTATTAVCSPDDDDWGAETLSEVRLDIVAP